MSVLAPLSLHSLSTMSKDNMLLGYARGKVGSLVFARRDGQQITRAYNANPANPRSTAQQGQRVLMATAIQVYRSMSNIVDHSFENAVGKAGNMRAFMSAALRDMKANDSQFSFLRWKERQFVPGPFQVSDGSLQAIPAPELSSTLDHVTIKFANITGESVSVASIANAMGLYKVGDMSTFLLCYPMATGGYGFTFVRFSLVGEPTGTIAPGAAVPASVIKTETPNGTIARSEVNLSSTGDVYQQISAAPAWLLSPGDAYLHCALIRSRFEDGKWLRSPATMKMGAGYVAAPTFEQALATYPQNDEPVLNGGQV